MADHWKFAHVFTMFVGVCDYPGLLGLAAIIYGITLVADFGF